MTNGVKLFTVLFLTVTMCCLKQLLELWTKRNFRCDCGNSKFGEFFCKLLTSKDVENPENLYNHNFKGTYCTCDRPDPDPNVEERMEMIQCCICEDWFHEEHIGLQSGDKVSIYYFFQWFLHLSWAGCICWLMMKIFQSEHQDAE